MFFFPFIVVDFSNFQEVLKFALQILPSDSLKELKTQTTTYSRHQKHKGRREWN
jgi:hypothetical protein